MLWKTQALVAIATLAALAAVAPAASGRATIETEIDMTAAYASGDHLIAFGHLFSEKRKCEAGRSMTLLVLPQGGSKFKKVDADRSSGKGIWALKLPGGPYDDHRLRASRKKLRNGDVCQAAKLGFNF